MSATAVPREPMARSAAHKSIGPTERPATGR